MTQLRIVIVNWNAGRLLRDCLISIIGADRSGFEIESVVVVDNASNDNSLDGLGEIGLNLKIIKNTENIGFAAACNQGAIGFDGDYLLFLNPDTRLYPVSLSKPLAFMGKRENVKVGVCGIQLIDETGNVSRSCARFPTPLAFFMQATGLSKLPWLSRFSLHMVDWDHAKTQQVEHVIGAFFLVRRSLFEQLNGFDELFFVYLEDLDFSKRMSVLGYKSFYLTNVQAFHLGGGTSRQVKSRRLFYSLRSRLQFAYKHYTRWQAFLVMFLTLIVEPCSRLAFCLVQSDWQKNVKETMTAYRWLYGALPQVLRGKRSR